MLEKRNKTKTIEDAKDEETANGNVNTAFKRHNHGHVRNPNKNISNGFSCRLSLNC